MPENETVDTPVEVEAAEDVATEDAGSSDVAAEVELEVEVDTEEVEDTPADEVPNDADGQ